MTSLKEEFSKFFELPYEIILDTPLIMMVGQKKMYIENHKGIALYEEDRIKVRFQGGYFIVEGKKLLITEIALEYIFISGNISSFSFEIKGGIGN